MSDEIQPNRPSREGSRIAKVIARAGLCSRRDAEAWIVAGRVSVNGKILERPAYNVIESDDVRVDGKPLAAPERTRLFLFHKAKGLVTTARDPEGRPTIFAALPEDLPRLVAVGRLDINTEGLMLLTNDGGLARVLELPATGWLRRYRVRAHGTVDQAKLDGLSEGVTLDGIDYAGIEAKLDREQGSNVWITMGLREGKNREIKKVLEHLGLAVNRLIRISFGPFELGDLAEGEIAEVRTRVLRDQLGGKLAKEAGADFDAPILDHTPPPAEPREERRERRAGPSRERDSVRNAPHVGRRGGRGPTREEAPQRRSPPAPSAPERRRKHVSALRAEIAADQAGPRRRIERSATHDRKGRTIAVERISPTGEEARKRAASETGPPRKKGRPQAGGRHGRTFEPGREAAERPRRSNPSEVKQARDGQGRERPPRSEHAERGARSEFKPRGARAEARGGPRERRFERPEGEPGAERRAKRARGGPRSDRNSPGSSRERPARSDRPSGPPRERKFDRSQGERRGKSESGPRRAAPASPGRSGRPPPKGPAKGPGRGSRRPPRKP